MQQVTVIQQHNQFDNGVLGDQMSRSLQYQRYLQMLRQGHTERSSNVPPIPNKGTQVCTSLLRTTIRSITDSQ